MKKFKTTLMTLGILLLLNACGGGGISTPESTVGATSNESQTILNTIFGEGFFANSLNAAKKKSLGINAISIEDTQNCSGGGSVSISGDSDFGFGATDITQTHTSTRTYNNCIEDGITLNGTLNNEYTSEFTSSKIKVDGTVVGSLEVSGLEEGSGTCGVGLNLKLDESYSGIDFPSTSTKITGSVCGTSVDETVTFESFQ